MLRGMGWQEGKPVGRNAKAVVKPIEYFARPRGLGLGAQPVPEAPSDRKYIKPGESREAQAHMVLPEGPDGRIRNIKTVDEKLVEKVKAGVHGAWIGWRALRRLGELCALLRARSSSTCQPLSLFPPCSFYRVDIPCLSFSAGIASRLTIPLSPSPPPRLLSRRRSR